MANWNALPIEKVEQIKTLNGEGLGPSAIGRQLDMPKSTVKSHIEVSIKTPTSWSEERIELLKRLWLNEGQSAGEIMRHKDMLGFTRSAIIGKVYRLGLTRSEELNQQAVTRGQLTRRGAGPRPMKPRVARPKVAVVTAEAPIAPETGPVNPAPIPLREIAASWSPSNPVPMGDQKRGHCCWPIETGAELQACNEPLSGRWCAVHATIGTKKDGSGPPRTREPAKLNYGARAPTRFGGGRGGYE